MSSPIATLPVAARHLATLSVAVLTYACGGGSGAFQVQKLGGGIFKLHCDAALTVCLQRADVLCKNASYDVLRAQERRDRFGGEVASSNVENRSSSAHIRCTTTGRPLLPWEDEEEGDNAQWKLPRRDVTPVPDARPPAHASPVPSPAAPAPIAPAAVAPTPASQFPASSKPASGAICVPGSTQACVGPAACNGGQSCLPDGSGFAPCDCGAQTPHPLKSSKPALP